MFAGNYLHAHNHNHTFIGGNYYLKRTNPKGRSRSIQLGFGAGRATYLQPTFSLSGGELKQHYLAGRWTIFPNMEYQLTFPAKFISEKSSIKWSFWNQYQFLYNNRGAYFFGFDIGLVIHKN